MRTLYFDCFSGISGDMILGALLDCGIDPEDLKRELGKLHIDGYELKITRSMKNGIGATDVDVILGDYGHHHDHDHDHHHDHDYHHNHEHNHECSKQNDHHGEHHHRNLMDIEKIIDESELNPAVKERAKLIFRKLAAAEAKIHGKSVEEVHFHEVGAVDSIIDIVGTAICLDMLKIDRFVTSPINTGMGFVRCQHGIIPVPAPAALELLKGFDIYSGDIKAELVTPTGAAVISSLCESSGPIPVMEVEKTGYGSGKKELEIPNLLRVIIGEEKKKRP